MAITNYSTLKSAVADWLNRSDLTSAIETFVQMAEQKFEREARLRKLTALSATITADGYALPTDFQSLESWYHDGPTYYGAIEIVGADQIGAMKGAHGATGVPAYAAIVDGTVRFAPAPDDTYTTKITYWRKIAALSDVATTNWLITAHPDVYLYGTLTESAPYLKDDERVAVWRQRYEEAAEQVHQATWREQFGGSMRRQARRVIGG